MNNPIQDKVFLNQLFTSQEREIYARITTLTFDEFPIEYIEGKVTDGSINIDGASAVRRTCSINMVAEEVNINEFYWGLKNKFKLEVGLKNYINPLYPDIIWFKQGVFVITQFNTTQSVNKWQIKIQGKDKMCLLNGDVSGNLPANVDFAYEEYYDVNTQKTTFNKVPIKTIINRALIEFGRELPQNIFINNLDEAGLELLEYKGTEPLYIFKDLQTEEFKQISVKNITCYYKLKSELTQEEYDLIPEKYNFLKEIYFKNNIGIYLFSEESANENEEYLNYLNEDGWFKGSIDDSFNIVYDDLLDDSEFEGNQIPTQIRFNLNVAFKDKRYTISKFEVGDIPGYRMRELTFDNELTAKAGESITSVLDKIKNKFTNFEYFYDIDGKFIFQKKQEYLSTYWDSDDAENNLLKINLNDNEEILFNFTDSKLISSFANTPKITELKNDYTVWGTRDKTTMHMRYAIDTKPTEYTPIRVLKEEELVLIKDASGNILKEKQKFKYYDAPEVEPYNDLGLKTWKYGQQFVDYAILSQGDSGITENDLTLIRKILVLSDIGLERVTYWLNKFKKEELYGAPIFRFHGTKTDLNEAFLELNEHSDINGNKISISIVPLEDNTEQWTIIYPYVAAYPYKTEDVYDINENGEKSLIHYKVDWRELIYQMALDYRKLNYTDNYFYYLKENNPWIINEKTGYEQYYIDIEGFWRLLYNPNPTPLFGEALEYNKIKEQSLLTDEDSLNDSFDMIYVKNPYSLITEENDIDSLSYKDLYVFSTGTAGKDITSIYPFVGSDKCCLTFNTNYYLQNNEEKMIKHAVPYNYKTNDADYLALNATSLDQVYIKNYEAFLTKNYTYHKYPVSIGGEMNKMTEALYNEYKHELFVLDEAGKYHLTKGDFNPNTQYYMKDTFGSNDIFISQKYPEKPEDLNPNDEILSFNSVVYPSVSQLTDYANATRQDYIHFIQKQFDKVKQDLIKNKALNQNKEFYYQQLGTIKLSDIMNDEKLWNLYYASDLYPLAYDILNSLSFLNSLQQDRENESYDNTYMEFLMTIAEILKTISLNINKYSNFSIIKTTFFNLLKELVEGYQSLLISNVIKFKEDIDKNYSCLYNLLELYESRFNIQLEESSISVDESILNCSTFLKKINLALQNLILNINNNYEQVRMVINSEDIINSYLTILADVNKTSEEKKAAQNELKMKLENLKISLKQNKETYKDGQLNKTVNVIDKILLEIEKTNPNNETIINLVNLMIANISLLTDTLMKIKDVIFNSFSESTFYQDFYYFLDNNVSKLYQILVIDDMNNIQAIKNDLQKLLIFKNIDLLDIYSSIDQATNIQGIKNIIINYNNTIKNFQEYLVLENINNFNIVKENSSLIFKPIEYYRAYYNFNRDKNTGNFWSLDIYENPHLLLFWIDFLEPFGSDIAKYSVSAIGSRTKVINDKDVKAIHYRDIPNIIFDNNSTDFEQLSGYTYINITSAFNNLFIKSSKSKTAKERIEELLYNHSYCQENINIQVAPVYNLEPNNKIYIRDEKSNIEGNYRINKITIPLNYKKMMTITGIKSVDSIM